MWAIRRSVCSWLGSVLLVVGGTTVAQEGGADSETSAVVRTFDERVGCA